jgi:hypothetical protein
LRQLLLTRGYFTIYEMAFIEAGNLEGLMLGPVRVIDKPTSTRHEDVYRVYDPRTKAESTLRHLAEPEMQDAVRPDEFVQRFTAAAAVRHSNVASVLEVLTIAGRPAVLLEHVPGLASGDWPALVATPGVWYRLVCQASLGLQAAHSAGLCHGHLDSNSFVLSVSGELKLLGLGEPRWLIAGEGQGGGGGGSEESVVADLAGLGALASAWSSLASSGQKDSSSKRKPLPDELLAVLAKLQITGTGQGGGYESAQALVEDLERAGSRVQSSNTAWERLLKQVRDQVPGVAGLRQSA